MIDCKLPPGWTSEGRDKRHTVLRCPEVGYVTIDWGRGDWYSTRGYRSGISTTGPLTNKTNYEGRGWKKRLLADAIAHLQGVYGTDAAKVERRPKQEGRRSVREA